MRSRLSRVLCTGVVTLLAGCGIASLIALPFELVFGLFGAIFDGVGSLVGAVAVIEPVEGPAPTLRQLDDGRWAVAGVTEGSRFDIVTTAPGHAPRRFRWPDDFGDVTPRAGERIDLDLRLHPLTLPSSTASDSGG